MKIADVAAKSPMALPVRPAGLPLVKMVGMPIERAIGLDGLYRKIFAGAVIVAATSAGDSGIELSIEI